jgi:hypothetical protein
MCEVKFIPNSCGLMCGLVMLCANIGVAAIPPDPNNAALLYYQAFLLCPEIPAPIFNEWNGVLRGDDPSNAIRGYLKDCDEAIGLAETATELPECNWGIPYSKGFGARLPQAAEGLRLCQVLWVSARVLACDGDDIAAFDRSMAIRRFARQIGDDTVFLYAVSGQIDGDAQICIRHILGGMPPEERTLTWLKAQLAGVEGAPRSPARALRADLELALQTMRANPDILLEVRRQLVESAEDESTRKQLQNLADEELISLARQPYSKFLDSAIQVIDGNMPYAEAYGEIQRLQAALESDFGTDPAVRQVIAACADQPLSMYHLQVSDEALLNALRVGIEVYLVIARTGQMPDTLSDDWLADPLTGDAFRYNLTDEGFVLSHSDKDIPGGGLRPIGFKVCR